MRTIGLIALLAALLTSPGIGQQRWARIADRGSQPFFADLTSLRKIDSVLQVDVRSSPGPMFFVVARYQVQCGTLALRTLSRRQYSDDLNRSSTDSAGRPVVIEYSESWLTFGLGSDGRLLAEAICRLGREQGLLG